MLIFLVVMLGLILYVVSLSNRIIRLDADVNRVFRFGKKGLQQFPDAKRTSDYDEITQLRHHIFQMLAQLESYERYLKQLPKMLRHELHNPLNRLTMALSLLEKQGDSQSRQQLDYAKRAVDQLKKIINSLSEASSIEESLEQHPPEPYYLDEMLQIYFNNLKETPLGQQLQIQCQLPHPTKVLGDGFMMEQLLDKLISNAMDFKLPDTQIEISCHIKYQQIEIIVKNQGVLIPKGSEKQIFDGMTSIRSLNQDEKTHLGLGLYIAKLIAEYHGGTIEAFNEEIHKSKPQPQSILTQTGTVVFRICLPLSLHQI